METTKLFSGLACARAQGAMLAATFVAATLGLVVPASAQTTPVAPTITFAASPSPTYPADFTVSATTNSDGALSYGAVSGPCAVIDASAGTFRATGAGACLVQADTAATAAYLAGSAQQTVTIAPADLWAVSGTVTLPDGASVPVLGYNSTNTAVAQPGGPTLIVNQGDTVSITLRNGLAENTALLVQGQNMVPDTTGVAPGGAKVYTFTASSPGTYLYEAGLLPSAQRQVAMGLYGALIVRPAVSGRAYADIGATAADEGALTAFDDEAVLVLSEIDPTLNRSPNPATFDMRNYAPTYFLINGKAYPATAPIASGPGRKVLLRYVNAGLKHHSMAVLGLRQNFVARDGSLLPTLTHDVAAETLASGQTADAIATVPAVTVDSQFAVYDANLMLHNSRAAGFGGMLTFVTAAGTGTGDTTGPVTSAMVLTAGSVSATVSDAATGSSNVSAAEFFIDTTGANGTGTAMSGPFGSVTVGVTASVSPAMTGTHTVYVHGQDAAGNWGPFQSKVFVNDVTGPTTSALGLTPNPSNGTTNATLSATANDTASGGANIAAAEYWIDGGAPVVMTIGTTGAQVASATATIPAATINALSQGAHVVSVRSQDSLGNWGAAATINLIVDKTGPATSSVSAAPNPSNGAVGFNSSTPAVRVTATVSDMASGGSNIAAAEGFIDTVGANGTGVVLQPTDGLFNSGSENAYVDIPLATIAALSNGSHTISVHGKDAAGNWGAMSATTLVVDKIAPTLSGAALSSNTIVFGTGSVTLNVTAADVGTGVAGGQYWIDGTTTPPANATAFTGTSATINTSALAAAVHTVYVRVRDAAGNWSTVSSATLTVILAVDDTRAITANTNAAQTSDQTAPGLLANDLPTGLAGRTARLASAPIRTSGTGAGTISVSCPAGLGTAATPAIGTNTVCTNGAYRLTLSGVGTTGSARRASKLGTFTFTYSEIVNGVASTATVTVTVN